MSFAIRGQPGTGEVEVYALTPLQTLVLETITFTLTTGLTTGVRTPEVLLLDSNAELIARIPDWNDISESMTATYTYGIGLTPFCGTINSGGSVQNDLPFCDLEPQSAIHLRTVDQTGAVFLDDAFSSITLWVADVSDSASGAGGGGRYSNPAAWWLYAAAG